jgi:NPCBM/NEW2 domain
VPDARRLGTPDVPVRHSLTYDMARYEIASFEVVTMHRCRTTLAALAVALLCRSVTHADEVKTLAGKTFTGTVTSVSPTDVEIKTDKGVEKIPLAQVLALNVRPLRDVSNQKFTEIRLLDESVLRASKVEYPGKDVDLTLLSGEKVQVPLSAIVSIARDPHSPELKEKWDKLFKRKARRDRAVIFRDGELQALEGTAGEVLPKEGKIQFKDVQGLGKDVDFALGNLYGIIFYRTDVLQDQPLCRVVDTFGNDVTALKVAFDGKEYSLTTTFGSKLAFKADAISNLDFNMGKLTYLSDMEPAKVVERSGAGLVTKYRKDTNLDGEPIILEKAHPKGLSMHAHTELEYNLAGRYKEFKALAGVDVRCGAESQARLRVYCDGKLELDKTVSAKGTLPIGISVRDVQTLKVVVSSGNFLDLHDHLTLADARVSQ